MDLFGRVPGVAAKGLCISSGVKPGSLSHHLVEGRGDRRQDLHRWHLHGRAVGGEGAGLGDHSMEEALIGLLCVKCLTPAHLPRTVETQGGSRCRSCRQS